MAFPLTVTLHLSTPVTPDGVWRAFEAVERWPETMPGIVAAVREPAGALAAGTLLRTRPRDSEAAERIYRVVAAEPPRRLVLALDEDDYRALTRYEITGAADGETDIVVTATLDAVGLVQSIRFLAWRERIKPVLTANTRERAEALVELAGRLSRS